MAAKLHIPPAQCPSKIQPHITEEAARRLKGHEKLLDEILLLAEQEAAGRGISLLEIDVLPAWSHEFDERTGVVVHTEVRATDEQRFSLWEAISERIDSLYDAVDPEEKNFLTDAVSVVVDRV
jgi:hypothetical protein